MVADVRIIAKGILPAAEAHVFHARNVPKRAARAEPPESDYRIEAKPAPPKSGLWPYRSAAGEASAATRCERGFS